MAGRRWGMGEARTKEGVDDGRRRARCKEDGWLEQQVRESDWSETRTTPQRKTGVGLTSAPIEPGRQNKRNPWLAGPVQNRRSGTSI